MVQDLHLELFLAKMVPNLRQTVTYHGNHTCLRGCKAVLVYATNYYPNMQKRDYGLANFGLSSDS
jgi:hypothetical protein